MYVDKKITKFSVGAFRGLQDMDLYDLSRVNVLVGNNNAGKTSLLESLFLYHNHSDIIPLMSMARHRDAYFSYPRTSGSSHLSRLEWLFPAQRSADNVDHEICLSGDGIIEKYSILMHKFIGIPDEKDIPKFARTGNRYPPSAFEEQQGAEIVMRISPKGFLPGIENEVREIIWEKLPFIRTRTSKETQQHAVFIEPHSHRFNEIYPKMYTEAYRAGIIDELVFLMQQFDENAKNFVLLGDEQDAVLCVEHAKAGIAPISTFGDGMRRVLYMSMSLVNTKGGVCLIDEFDNSIHRDGLASTAKWIISVAHQLNIQLFLTTHSLETLDALIDVAGDEDLAIYHLATSSSRQKRFSRDMALRLRNDRGLDMR